MSNFTIGRVGIDMHVESISGWSESGTRVSISGRTTYGSVADGLAVRQQLLGYVDSADESFVPVTWAEQPEVDGYYRVRSADVDAHPGLAFAGVYTFSLDLERVSGFAAPLIESVCVGSLRASSLALTGRNVIGIPGAALSYVEWSRPTFTARSVDVSRIGETSRVVVFKSTNAQYVGQFYLPPASFYDGAATLKMGYPARVVVGRQVPNLPTDWEMSNDLMQVRPSVSALSFVDVRMWMDGAWSPWVGVDFQSDWLASHMGLRDPHTITVLANSPEAVSIRLLTVSNYTVPVMLDLTLRRGARYVSVELHSPQAANFAVGNRAPSTALTGGFSMPTGTTGLTYFVGSAIVLQYSLNGIHPNEGGVAAVTHFPFCFGLTDTTETAQDMLNEYFWAGSEKQTVVAR